MKGFSDNFRVISEDKRTVKIGQDSNISFRIYDSNTNEILQLLMPPASTVSDMMAAIGHKLKNKNMPVDKIVCLQSLDNREVIDYALLIGDYELKNFTNHESFRIIISEEVKSDRWVSLNDFIFKKCLGQGASANVSLVRHRANGKLYALKQIEKGYFVEFKRMQQILR